MAKEIIKGILKVVGFTVCFTGICICACESPTLDGQLFNLGLGFAVAAFGGLTMWIGVKGSDCFG